MFSVRLGIGLVLGLELGLGLGREYRIRIRIRVRVRIWVSSTVTSNFWRVGTTNPFRKRRIHSISNVN